MTGQEFRQIREEFGIGRTRLALLLGYVGSDRNNNLAIRRLEEEELVPLKVARFLWLILKHYQRTGKPPAWPENLRLEGEDEPWT